MVFLVAPPEEPGAALPVRCWLLSGRSVEANRGRRAFFTNAAKSTTDSCKRCEDKEAYGMNERRAVVAICYSAPPVLVG